MCGVLLVREHSSWHSNVSYNLLTDELLDNMEDTMPGGSRFAVRRTSFPVDSMFSNSDEMAR